MFWTPFNSSKATQRKFSADPTAIPLPEPPTKHIASSQHGFPRLNMPLKTSQDRSKNNNNLVTFISNNASSNNDDSVVNPRLVRGRVVFKTKRR